MVRQWCTIQKSTTWLYCNTLALERVTQLIAFKKKGPSFPPFPQNERLFAKEMCWATKRTWNSRWGTRVPYHAPLSSWLFHDINSGLILARQAHLSPYLAATLRSGDKALTSEEEPGYDVFVCILDEFEMLRKCLTVSRSLHLTDYSGVRAHNLVGFHWLT